MVKTLLTIIGLAGFLLVIGCQSEIQKTEDPYFGNGFRNGWADQQSIVIWTRLTKNKEMNVNGQPFVPMTYQEERALEGSKDGDKLYNLQVPEGLSLEDMEGACPGTSGQVRLMYYPMDKLQDKQSTDWKAVDTTKNFTTQWKLKNLKANTKYYITIQARKSEQTDISDSVDGHFVTPPTEKQVKPINFGIVSCHDYIRRDSIHGHRIYPAMAQDSLDFYVHTGDIEYYDKPNPYAFTEELMRFKWDRLFALPLQRSFYTKTTTYFMKDDHDALQNDAYQGMTYGPVTFDRGIEIFDKEQFPTSEKTYKTVRWGRDLQVWLLEGRNYRSKNTDVDGPDKTILGAAQKQWLFETIQASDATFKVIISASPILGPDRPKGKNDNHSNESFAYEGNELRNFINQFDNVFVCNGDRHWQYVSHIEGTNLWEFGTGSGADSHAGGWDPDDWKPEHKFLRVKGGYLLGRLKQEANSVKLVFEHKDVNGNTVHRQQFSRSNDN